MLTTCHGTGVEIISALDLSAAAAQVLNNRILKAQSKLEEAQRMQELFSAWTTAMLTLLPHERKLSKSIYPLSLDSWITERWWKTRGQKKTYGMCFSFYSEEKKHKIPLEEFGVNWAALPSRKA